MKNLIFLTLGAFTVGSSSFMIAGLLPKIGETIGQSVSVASQGITAYALTYLISATLFSVVFANKSAKRILQIALAFFLLGNLLTITADNILVFILGRILTGLGAGIFNPLCVSVAVQLGSISSKGKVLSLVSGANSAGVVFGVPFGVYISSVANWQLSIGYVFFLALVTLVGFSLQKADINLPTGSSIQERLRVLVDRNVLAVIAISCFTALASLGLYSYVAIIHKGSPHTLATFLFFWGLGGFLGSSSVGFFVDKYKNPRVVMAFIITGLMLSVATIPFTKNLPFIGLISFMLWGAFGWATSTPQQHVLFGLNENQKTILSALNSSAFGLGSSLGTAIGGILIAAGLNVMNFPFFAAVFLLGVVVAQLLLVEKFRIRERVRE